MMMTAKTMTTITMTLTTTTMMTMTLPTCCGRGLWGGGGGQCVHMDAIIMV
jgi:hypothetical protein